MPATPSGDETRSSIGLIPGEPDPQEGGLGYGWHDTPQGLVGVFDAVIFDHDGTIVNSHDAMVRAYTKWAGEYDIDLQQLPGFLGRPSSAIAEALVAADLQQEAAQRIEDLEVSDTEGVVAMPGTVAAFAALPRELVAIATSCTRALLVARMAAAGLEQPEVVVTRDDVRVGKPSPESFLLAAERLGVAPGRALVVEDAPAGVAAARAGGFPVLGILGEGSQSTLEADACVADLSWVRWELVAGRVRLTLPRPA